MKTVLEFIRENTDKCVRVNNFDDETLIGLPYPYSVPCISNKFQEMYYWDTYFTNVGLIIEGDIQQAKCNAENIAFLIRKYGFMPNGSRTYYLGRSQPPFFSEMVFDIYECTKDKKWLESIIDAVEIEYDFWSEYRMTKTGLIQYCPKLKDEDTERLYNYFNDRIGADVSGLEKKDVARTTLIGCESGWDFTPRWGVKSKDFVQIDLNCLIYKLLKNLEYFSTLLNNGKDEHYGSLAHNQAVLIREYMINDDGLFMDYDFCNNKTGEIFSAASFYPLAFNLATLDEAQIAIKNLFRIEQEYGISACERYDVSGIYQWHYPNGWAPLQYIVIKGLINYGYLNDAVRISKKYVDIVDKNFKVTGNIWEKYNVVDGSINVTNEYNMPPMLGWTAGVYLFCKHILDKQK